MTEREFPWDAGTDMESGRTGRRVWGWAVTLTLVLTYLVVSSSVEFSPFAPMKTPHSALYTGFVVSGAVVGYVAKSPRTAALVMALLCITPLFIYGGGMVVLPAISGQALLVDLFIFWALQRVLMFLLLAVIFGYTGLFFGLVKRELS